MKQIQYAKTDDERAAHFQNTIEKLKKEFISSLDNQAEKIKLKNDKNLIQNYQNKLFKDQKIRIIKKDQNLAEKFMHTVKLANHSFFKQSEIERLEDPLPYIIKKSKIGNKLKDEKEFEQN